MRSRRTLLAGMAVVAIAVGACGSTSTTTAPSVAPTTAASVAPTTAASVAPTTAASVAPSAASKGATVGLSPKAVTIAFFDFVNKGATAAAGELSGKTIYNGPTQPLGPDQIPFVDQFANQKVDCIAIAGDDPNAVAPGLKQAIQDGIKVVSYDSDVAPDARQIFVADSTDDLIARTQVQMLAEQMNYEGDFAILSTTPTTTNQVAWINIMKDELTKPAYAKMKLVQTAYGEGQVDKAALATDGLIKGFPNLKGILAPDVPAGVGAPAQPDAELCQGRHGQGVHPLQPVRRRVPGPVRVQRARIRPDHGSEGRQVHRRQARRADRGGQRHCRPRTADQVQQGQHRQRRLLSRRTPMRSGNFLLS